MVWFLRTASRGREECIAAIRHRPQKSPPLYFSLTSPAVDISHCRSRCPVTCSRQLWDKMPLAGAGSALFFFSSSHCSRGNQGMLLAERHWWCFAQSLQLLCWLLLWHWSPPADTRWPTWAPCPCHSSLRWTRSPALTSAGFCCNWWQSKWRSWGDWQEHAFSWWRQRWMFGDDWRCCSKEQDQSGSGCPDPGRFLERRSTFCQSLPFFPLLFGNIRKSSDEGRPVLIRGGLSRFCCGPGCCVAYAFLLSMLDEGSEE